MNANINPFTPDPVFHVTNNWNRHQEYKCLSELAHHDFAYRLARIERGTSLTNFGLTVAETEAAGHAYWVRYERMT